MATPRWMPFPPADRNRKPPSKMEMMRIMDVEGRKAKQEAAAAKYIFAEGAEFLPYLPHANLTINELGKQLLKAATDGNVNEIRILLAKGAPFTADWLGTSPLHLAAQNNHLDVCEILLRAGMSRDARTKVDRTPLHMAAYEGHLEIVECLLKNGADCDSKDLLHMTPLHWAAQNGHDEVAALLIRYGAMTNPVNKFDLTPADIAMQVNRPDIVQIIDISLRDPMVATQHLALELISENSTESAVEPIINLGVDNDTQDIDSDAPHIPLETIMIEDETENSIEPSSEQQYEEQNEDSQTFNVVDTGNDFLLTESLQDTIEKIEPETNNFSESIKLLQQHGITMLPVDDSTILNSVMESGHSVVLTEAGKQVLNSFKSSEPNHDLSEYLKPKTVVPAVKKKKIITVTAEEFLAMTNSGAFGGAQTNILKQFNGKIVNHQKSPPKRIVMRKNKVMPISPSINVTKVQRIEAAHDVDSLMEELQKAHTLIESYKRKLLKSEFEVARYKQQLQLLMDQHRLSST